MSARILLCRHAPHADIGHRLSGRAGPGLGPEGRARAERLARRLADEGLTALHAGPQQRTRDTAAAIADRTGLDVVVVDALDEVDFGTWTGQSFDALDPDPAWQAWNARRATDCPPGGERMGDAVRRAARHIVASAATGEGPIAMVTHCDVIRGVVADALGLSLDHLLRFDVDPASISRLAVDGEAMRIVSLNETA